MRKPHSQSQPMSPACIPGSCNARTADASIGRAPTGLICSLVSGVLGPLIGANLLHIRDIAALETGIASIGGAGTFDGIVLSGNSRGLFGMSSGPFMLAYTMGLLHCFKTERISPLALDGLRNKATMTSPCRRHSMIKSPTSQDSVLPLR